jgi:uncharacterized protein
MNSLITFIKENIRLIIGAFLLIFAIALIVTFAMSRRSPKVTVNGQSFKVTVAKTEDQKQIGLSETERLRDNEGMLFVFDSAGHYPFWMKNMKFPIDIIYINGDKVTTVIDSAKPSNESDENLDIYQPDERSDKVLEIKAGLARKHQIKKGSTVKIENL